MSCWNCNENVQGPVCAGCGVIQAPRPEADLFGIMGLPRRYHLDSRELERAYRSVSRKVHPDRFTGKRAVERQMSLQWTAALNEARRVLKDPERRALYLATGQKSPLEQGGPILDTDFMEVVFELQMGARTEPESVRQAVADHRSAIEAELETIFTAWEAGEGELDLVEDRLARLRYLGTAERLVTEA